MEHFAHLNFQFEQYIFIQTFDKETRKASIVIKRKSSIPLILRDMAPPEGSIFDPAKVWNEEKARRTVAKDLAALEESNKAKAAAEGSKKKKKKDVKKTTAEMIKQSNSADKVLKDHVRDLQKLSNLKSLEALQDATCDTSSGKINRMIKMLHFAVSDLKNGNVNGSEAEVLDILWALEEMESFKNLDKEIQKEKSSKKEEKEDKKKSKKDSKKDKKDSKKDKKEEKKEKIVLSADAKQLKELYKDGDNRGSYKDSLKFARKLMSSKKNLISFQLLEMNDRLPPLSRYNRKFRLEDWQCAVLEAIDNRSSAVVCAPTSSGKTLLSTYTCKSVADLESNGTVLFVLPSEVLVWQVASTYYQFFKGNVTIW